MTINALISPNPLPSAAKAVEPGDLERGDRDFCGSKPTVSPHPKGGAMMRVVSTGNDIAADKGKALRRRDEVSRVGD